MQSPNAVQPPLLIYLPDVIKLSDRAQLILLVSYVVISVPVYGLARFAGIVSLAAATLVVASSVNQAALSRRGQLLQDAR